MLDRAHRLTRGADYATAVRRGRRAGTGTLVVHLWTPGPGSAEATASGRADVAAPPARMGLVVGRSVGDAVTRNRVKRRLRHLARPLLDGIPPGSLLVVRALPAAGTAAGPQLGEDLTRALARLLRPKEVRR